MKLENYKVCKISRGNCKKLKSYEASRIVVQAEEYKLNIRNQ